MRARGPVATRWQGRAGQPVMVGAGVAMTLLASTMTPVRAQGPACSRMQFEAVVADAAGALRDLNAQNRPLFQSKLRALKDKRGWSHEQFLREATPLVQDTTTETYDKESTSFLEKIQSMGEEGATAKEPDCSHLTELRTTMQSLVASQNAKWQYMLKRVDEELAK